MTPDTPVLKLATNRDAQRHDGAATHLEFSMSKETDLLRRAAEQTNRSE